MDFENQVLAPFLTTIKNETDRPKYLRAYRLMCNYLNKFNFLDFDAEDVKSYSEHLTGKVVSQEFKPNYASSLFRRCSAIATFAEEHAEDLKIEAYISPFKEQPFTLHSTSVPVASMPTVDEIDKLLSLAQTEPLLYTVISITYMLALRPSEIVNIKMEDFFYAPNKALVLMIEKGSRVRHLNVPIEVKKVFDDYFDRMGIVSGHIFLNTKSEPISVRVLENRYCKLFNKGDFVRRFSLNDIRNASVTTMFNNGAGGAEVSEYLGIGTNYLNKYELATKKVHVLYNNYSNIIVKPLYDRSDGYEKKTKTD